MVSEIHATVIGKTQKQTNHQPQGTPRSRGATELGVRLPTGGVRMQISDIPFGTTDWSQIERTEHKGETGSAYWRTQHFGNIRVRFLYFLCRSVTEGGKCEKAIDRRHVGVRALRAL
jgi:hypothetical protein